MTTIADVALPIEERWGIKRCRYATEGASAGRVCIATGTHGDEMMGQLIVYRIEQRIAANPNALNGVVDFYPMLNPLGLDIAHRMVPSATRLDMNRAFPGSPDGTPLEYLCWQIIQDMSGADLVLDIHASARNKSELYEVRVSAKEADRLLPRVRALCPQLIWVYPDKGSFSASLTGALGAAGVDAAILEAEGYRNCPESAAWHLVPGGKYYTTRNGSAILAWRMPKGPLTGWHAAASHSDSPTWRIKTLDGADHGFARAEVEGYGGMLMSTWFDRPLSVAGRLLVRTADGVESRLVHPERALACIPNLCIHFNREANTGLNYNPQVDLQPIFGAEGGSLKDTLAAEAGGKAEDILATDLVLCITEKAQRVGLQGEYFMSGRIDDLECAYATLYGFLQGRGEEAGRGDIWVMFDNEEVGSSSRQGAQGTLMADVLARIEESLGVTKEQSIRARTNCLLLSADNGHAIHPNHPEKSDQKLPVNMGGGVILKYNARQTYTTSGLTGAAFTAICEKAGVPVQTFANRADVAGGSTLGNLLGRQILMPMVDIGVGQLAMHSAMETASCKDAEYLANACAAYYNTPIFQPKDGEWKLGL